MSEWIDCEKELPPCDGWYEICDSNATSQYDYYIGQALYDGIGFIVKNSYREPKYWRQIVIKKKRYGKIENE